MWDLMPDNLKVLSNGEAFKQNMRKWKLDNCPCSLCQVCVNSIRFL